MASIIKVHLATIAFLGAIGGLVTIGTNYPNIAAVVSLGLAGIAIYGFTYVAFRENLR